MAHCKDVENFNRILECPICLERMRDPRHLPCLHSFCGKCIGQHMDEKQTNGTFPCPICKLEFQVPQDGAMGFKRNLYLVQISELFPEESEVKCDICKLHGPENPATSMCINCRDHMCQRCAESHCFSKFTHDHKVVSLEEIRNGQHLVEIRRFQKVHCPKHPDKVMEVYCENCVKPMCYLCAMLEHKLHEMKNLEEAAKEVDDVLRGLLDTWKMASDHSAVLSVERKKILDSLDETEEQFIAKIEQVYSRFKDEIIEEIDLKKNDSIGQLKAEVASARKRAETAYNEAEFSRTNITSTLKYCQDILDSAQDAEKLQQFQDIKRRLEDLDIRKLETEVTRPVFKLQPDTLIVPDLRLKPVTEADKERVTLSVSEQTWLPDLKEKATVVRCCSVRIPGELTTDRYYGLAATDDWLIIPRSGSLYTAKKVKVFSRSNDTFLFEVDIDQHELQLPMGVTYSNRGEIFVTDKGIKGVVKYNSKGQLMKVTCGLYKDDGRVTCHDDQLVVTDCQGGRVLIADFDCNVKKEINKESLGLSTFKPYYVCVDNEGHLVVSDSGQGRVHVIDYKQPAIIKTFSELLSACPYGVCADEWGHILVADFGNNQVVLVSSQSEHARVIVTRGDVIHPTDLAVTGPGEVAVLEWNTGNMKVFKYAGV